MKFVNKWNLPLLVLSVTMGLTAIAVLVTFVLRLVGVTTIDIITVTIPLGVVVVLVIAWAFVLFIYSKVSHKGFLDDNGSTYESDFESDDGWE
jgi:hypothetical protein